MIPLKTAGVAEGVPQTYVGRVVGHPTVDGAFVVARAVPLGRSPGPLSIELLTDEASVSASARISGIPSLAHLEDGDIVAVHPSGRVDTLFRRSSPNNSLFVTERCNSKCIMCSQPPRVVDDIDYFFALNSTLVSLLPKSLPVLGVTGGEPTLLGGTLVELLNTVARELPQTQLEILSNGRALSRPAFADAVSGASTRKTLFTIPLYADYAPLHDYVVQAKDAFSQTVLGLHNLARVGVRSEIRIVLHRQSHARLPQLARFIQRNLPFVEHVAFMGLEHTGYARLHDLELWMEPPAYAAKLEQAVGYLSDFGYPVSIYNLQACVLPVSLRPFLRSSISDWKREFLPACEGCALRDECGGVFGTSRRHSEFIRAVPRS